MKSSGWSLHRHSMLISRWLINHPPCSALTARVYIIWVGVVKKDRASHETKFQNLVSQESGRSCMSSIDIYRRVLWRGTQLGVHFHLHNQLLDGILDNSSVICYMETCIYQWKGIRMKSTGWKNACSGDASWVWSIEHKWQFTSPGGHLEHCVRTWWQCYHRAKSFHGVCFLFSLCG